MFTTTKAEENLVPTKFFDFNLLQDALENESSDKYYFNIMVHCGFNLPVVQSDVLPSPFVTAKTTLDAKEKRPAKAATCAATNTR